MPYFSNKHFTWTTQGLTRASGMTRWRLTVWVTTRLKTLSAVVIYTLQRYKEHLILKRYQIIVLAPNCLMLAEIDCRLGGMCCLHHQSRRESLASLAASSIFKTQISAFFCQISRRHIPPKTPIFNHCHHKL